MPKVTNSVIRQLQLVFSLSTLLLLISLGASYFSIRKLIDNAELVNHTNQVLIEAENIISYMKDAETGQRGYLITNNPLFLQPFADSHKQVNASYYRLQSLLADSPAQRKKLAQAKDLYEVKFAQMQRIIDLMNRSRNIGRDTVQRHQEMLRGKQIMDNLRVVINQMKTAETTLLQDRTQQLQLYSRYTPILLVIAAMISMLITAFTYVRIRKNMDDRLKEQQDAEATYAETARRITALEGVTRRIADGDYTVRSADIQDDEMGRVVTALNKMAVSLEETFVDLQNKNWLQAGSAKVSDAIRGETNIHTLANHILETFADYLDAPVGAIYVADELRQFVLSGSYATHQAPDRVKVGEGLVGQAIARKKTTVVQHLPTDYSRVTSSVGSATPTALIIAPLVYNNVCLGVIELGLLRTPSPQDIAFVDTNREAVAISINAALDYVRLERFLEETQAQSEELKAQHEEMETMNAELETQTQKLQASEEELRVQQEELQQTNAELEERGLLLEERNNDIQKKADELEVATRYKSEFLANMSHELRTPLNSILLLSRLLAENADETLNGDQIEYAQVIQSSGNGLLGLIDEILDLSKIEAGQMQLENEPVAISEITDELQGLFGIIAKEKQLDFSIIVDPAVPTTIDTDKLRLGQILKNLLSNAIKFTASGHVTLTIRKHGNHNDQLSFVVADTGIGIPVEKQPLIFEAFQQADGSTKRKYGGTGLGLSISRELAKLLGGQITLNSTVNQGSEFTLHLPTSGGTAVIPVNKVAGQPVHLPVSPVSSEPIANKYLSTTIPEAIPDDRTTITAGDKVILIIEDDTSFAKALLDYARTKGYKGIVAVRGDEGPTLAATFKPSGILLDVQLPVMSGWDVMDALKADPKTRPIPVHMMSSHKVKNESRMRGAIDFVDKPLAFEQMQDVFKKIEYVLNRDTKKVLIVEDNPKHAKALAYFLESFNIRSELKSDITEGIDALKRNDLECVILDMGVPDAKAYETLETVKKNPGLENLPIIIFTGKSLSMAEELKIKKYADSIIVKTAHSYQRMLDEVSLFLHLVEENKPALDKAIPKKLRGLNQVLTGKTVLVADDDVRNIFALSKALEQYNMTVIAALDGKEALEKLADNPGVDVVLLDMMMPQMDGYETAQKIREHYQWKKLPVIAVTAKAMTGDRERCIQAGASDYITKPVDIDQLISLLRVWLYDSK